MGSLLFGFLNFAAWRLGERQSESGEDYSRAKLAKDAKENDKREGGGAFANVACLARNKSESGEEYFPAKAQRRQGSEKLKMGFRFLAS